MSYMIYDIAGEGDEFHGHYNEDFMGKIRLYEIEAEKEATYYDYDRTFSRTSYQQLWSPAPFDLPMPPKSWLTK